MCRLYLILSDSSTQIYGWCFTFSSNTLNVHLIAKVLFISFCGYLHNCTLVNITIHLSGFIPVCQSVKIFLSDFITLHITHSFEKSLTVGLRLSVMSLMQTKNEADQSTVPFGNPEVTEDVDLSLTNTFCFLQREKI